MVRLGDTRDTASSSLSVKAWGLGRWEVESPGQAYLSSQNC